MVNIFIKLNIDQIYNVHAAVGGYFPHMLYVGEDKHREGHFPQFIRRGGGEEIRLNFNLGGGLDGITTNGWHEQLIVDLTLNCGDILRTKNNEVYATKFTSLWTHDMAMKENPAELLKEFDRKLREGIQHG